MKDEATERLSRKGLFHLGLVYFVWSTTYLAMRIGVTPGDGFPPFLFGAFRAPVAAAILLAISFLRGLPMRPTRSESVSLIATGWLLWLGGNGLILWAEQYAASGFACLMVSSAPIWVTILELLLYRKKPPLSLVVSLVLGFGGVAVLSAASFEISGTTRVSAIVALVLAPLSWALGSVIQSRRPVSLAPQVMSGYQQAAASVGFAPLALGFQESVPHPGVGAWLAWGYLVVFGSVIAFTSFVVVLQLLPINIVMTYAYVNPVLALFLGWLLLGEAVPAITMVGASLVMVSVFMIFRIRSVAGVTRR